MCAKRRARGGISHMRWPNHRLTTEAGKHKGEKSIYNI